MARTPKKFCPNDSFYGYDVKDVVKIGGPAGKPGQSIKGDKGDKGDPGKDGDKHYRHVQSGPSASWEIAHNLNKKPSVTVVDSGGSQVEGHVTHVDQQNLVVIFSAAFAGEAYCN